MRKWRKRILKLMVLMLLIPLLLAAFLVFERIRGKISLSRYKRTLIALGEKLSPQDFTSSSTNGENGAPEVFAAISELKEGTVLPKRYPPRMQLTPSGRAVVCFREDEWIENKVTNNWNQIFDDLETNKETLNRIRAALEKPVLNNKLDYSQGPKMTFKHLAPAKVITYWLGAGSQLALHESRTHDALEYLIPQIRLPRLLAADRIVISELVRIAIGAIAKSDTWEALQTDGWTNEDLALIQQTWDAQYFVVGMAHGLEGELVFVDATSELCRKSNEETGRLLFGLEEIFQTDDTERPSWERTLKYFPGGDAAVEFVKKQVYCRLWRFAWLDQEERHTLEYVHGLLANARTGAAEKSLMAIEPAMTRLGLASSNRNLYDKLRYPDSNSPFSLSRTVFRAMRAETERSMVICAVALKRYSLRYGAPPDSLDLLVPEFVTSVPIDYMDGKPLKYHLNTAKTFVLYSVGEDGKDDGGDNTLRSDKKTFRDLWYRKDAVWPAPALPEEVEAYRKEAARN